MRNEAGGDRVPLEEARAQTRFPFYGLLDSIRSAHNVGSIFRTSDGANASGLFLCGYTPTPPHRHLAKTALGAVDSVPWSHHETFHEGIAAARATGARILAFEFTEDSRSLYEVELDFPVCLVMGNETNGLSIEARELCDATVHLPMYGHKSSLNVSVAFGVAMYEVLRRYEMLKK